MRNISKDVAFKYHYNGEANIEEEFQPAKEGVEHVDVFSLQQARLRHT